MSKKVVERGSWSVSEIPSSWEWSEFNILFINITDSFRKLKQSGYYKTGKFPVIDQGSQFIAGYTNDSNLVLPSKPPFVLFGDHTKCIKFIDFPFVQGADGVKVFSVQEVLPKYAYYAMRTIVLPDKGYSRHFKFLKESFFPIAPLSEQRRIVAKIEELFSELDAGISALKRVQANLNRYRASVLKAAVEGQLTEQWRAEHPDVEPAGELLKRILAERRKKWEEDQLAKYEAKGKKPPENWKDKYKEPAHPDTTNLPELPNGWSWTTIDQCSGRIQYGSSTKCSESSNGIPVLRMGNIRTAGGLDLSKLKYLPKYHKEFPGLLLKNGDILFNRTNSPELVGKTMVYEGNPAPCSFASYLIRVRLLPGLSPKFLSACLNSGFGRLWIKQVVNQTVGQANVNGTKLSRFTFPLPPEEEQSVIISEIEKVTSIIVCVAQTTAKQLKLSGRLRQGVLKRAFEGRLVPQDPNDEPADVLLERIKSEREKLEKANKQSKTIRRRKRAKHGK